MTEQQKLEVFVSYEERKLLFGVQDEKVIAYHCAVKGCDSLLQHHYYDNKDNAPSLCSKCDKALAQGELLRNLKFIE